MQNFKSDYSNCYCFTHIHQEFQKPKTWDHSRAFEAFSGSCCCCCWCCCKAMDLRCISRHLLIPTVQITTHKKNQTKMGQNSNKTTFSLSKTGRRTLFLSRNQRFFNFEIWKIVTYSRRRRNRGDGGPSGLVGPLFLLHPFLSFVLQTLSLSSVVR